MNSQKDEKWLDELIRRTIETGEPRFDAEEWKRKYPEEYRILLSRGTSVSSTSVRWGDILKSRILKFAVAAVVIVMFSFFLNRDEVSHIEPATKPVQESKSPTHIISMMSMRTSYQHGGFEALDQQFRDTLDVLGPQPSRISITELLEVTYGS